MQIRAESIEGLASKIVSDYFLKSSPINPTAELDESLKKMIGLLELDKKEFEDFVEELNRKRWQADFSRMP